MREKRVVRYLPTALGFSLLAVLPSEALSEASRKNPKALAPEVRLSPSFEANRGQTDPRVKFVSRGKGYVLFLTANEAVLAFQTVERRPESKEGEEVSRPPSGSSPHPPLTIKLLGANPSPEIKGIRELLGKSHYFLGDNPSKWYTNVPSYARVEYKHAYPGVDLVYYGKGQQLEYDFIVGPGADPGAIKLAFEGALELRINEEGDLLVKAAGGEIRLLKPTAYQEEDGFLRLIPAHYLLEGVDKVGFELADYDVRRELVIDPVLAYSTYLGGIASDIANSIALDAAGNIYVTGQTESPDFPTANAIQPTIGESGDAFVLKLDSTGTTLLYSTYLGGSQADRGNSIAVDSEGNAYITGRVGSDDFPITPGAPIPSFRGGMFDAFVAKLDAGGALVYSTYLGGFDNDAGFGIAVDSAGSAYVTGGTRSEDFPILANAFQPNLGGALDAFVTVLNAEGSALLYSTYLGGSFVDRGNGIRVDSEGNAYVTGWTESLDFPVANAFQPASGGGRDAFVAKLNAEGTDLAYSTYLGGSNEDAGLGIAVDSYGNAYITGYADSTNFPTENPYQPDNGGFRDAFVTKLNAEGNGLVYSTYLGGSGSENLLALMDVGATAGGIAVDSAGSAYVTGVTRSPDFPTQIPLQPSYGGGLEDAFVAKLNAEGALIYSTFLGGL
ncbi:MAG: SBBP repeat-containing protein, partial [Candidatus Binatia bacterium]